jgi:hypothetical protein
MTSIRSRLGLLALLLMIGLAACGNPAKPGVQVRSGNPPPVIHSSSTSLPFNPACSKPGVMAKAIAIAKVAEVDQAKALGLLKAASVDVQTCMSTPTGRSSESGAQQVSP